MTMPPRLTDAQKEVVYDMAGLFVVKACPGSGKTLTVAARLHRLLTKWHSHHAGIQLLNAVHYALNWNSNSQEHRLVAIFLCKLEE